MLNKNRGRAHRRFAKGSRAWAICDRCGLRSKYSDMHFEPGTGLFVDSKCDDGQYSKVNHPQLGVPDTYEAIGLENPRKDRREETVLMTSANGSVTLDSRGLFYFASSQKNILGEDYVSGA